MGHGATTPGGGSASATVGGNTSGEIQEDPFAPWAHPHGKRHDLGWEYGTDTPLPGRLPRRATPHALDFDKAASNP
eukprot:29105-Pelagomonas_calceolata.AAC.1